MDALTLEAEARATQGKQVKALRRRGFTPVHLYGKGITPAGLQVHSVILQKLVAQAGRNTPVTLTVKGEKDSHFAFIREIQRHPVTEAIIHVDFLQVQLTETIRAAVPVYLRGDAPAVRALSGVLMHALRSIQVECLPLKVPQFVEVDVTSLDSFDKAIHVSDILIAEDVKVITPQDDLVARVIPPRVEVEEAAAPTAEVEVAEAAGEAEAGEASAKEEQPQG